jgi:hypothetical protein
LDIIALYVKDEGEDLVLRLDFLDINLIDQQDIYISVDFKPAGSEFYSLNTDPILPSEIQWDIRLEFPSAGKIRGYDSKGDLLSGIKARVYRDTFLDMIIINVSKKNLLPEDSPIKLEVLAIDSTTKQIIDQVHPINSKALPPNPVQMTLGFWNSFQAYTPAQSLRSWDGAHSGPMSIRHGLRHLLNASIENGVPITLYDLGSPISKSALDYLGIFSELEELVQAGVVTVRKGGCGYFYGGEDYVVSLGISGYAKFIHFQNPDPISLEFRRELVNAAIGGKNILVGGDFSDSIWGNPTAATSAFYYLRNHPWIFTGTSLELTRQLTLQAKECEEHSELQKYLAQTMYDLYKKAYVSTPENILKELAWQTYSTIISSIDHDVSSIAGNHFWQLGHILAAAHWYEEPFTISSCTIDIDWDGQNECVLSSKNMFLTFELTGGYLAFWFYLDEEGVHQIIAPMSEVIVGLGDPMTYDISNGPYVDPALIPGALVNREEINTEYSSKNGEDYIELSNIESGIHKAFRINNNSIQIEWETEQAESYSVPLSLDPWMRFDRDWSDRYYKQQIDNRWIWGIENDIGVQIASAANYRLDTFMDSKGLTGQQEDPNFEYPRGHYLPFSFSMITVSPTESASIEINILDP